MDTLRDWPFDIYGGPEYYPRCIFSGIPEKETSCLANNQFLYDFYKALVRNDLFSTKYQMEIFFSHSSVPQPPHKYQMAALKRLCHLPTPIVSCNQLIQHISEKQIAKEARMKENILDLRVVHVNMVKNVRYQGVAGNTTMTNVLTLHNTFVQQK